MGLEGVNDCYRQKIDELERELINAREEEGINMGKRVKGFAIMSSNQSFYLDCNDGGMDNENASTN